MATTTSTAPSAASMTSAVSGLSDAIKAARDRVTAQSTGSGTAGVAGADKAPEIQEYRKDVRKSPFNHAGAATDIGMLVKNNSRLNAFSSMQANDPADFYKFRAVTSGEATLGQLGDEKTVRFQLMTRSGVVLADSNEKAGKTRENYDKLKEGAFNLDRGDYVIRVSREAGVNPKETPNYGFQLRMGGFTKDYDTVAKAPQPGDGLPTQSQGMQKLQAMLNSGNAFISSLPPIGTKATDKLLGTVFNTKV